MIHAAGIAGDGFLFRKDVDTFRRTLDAKVLGATVLDRVTAADPPDLMMTFGSTVAVFGAAGQGDYTAANQFLAAFAEERARRGQRTVNVAWSDWLDVGMAADHGVVRDQGFFRSLSAADGIGSFDEICAGSLAHVVVGEVNLARLAGEGAQALDDVLRRPPVVLSETISASIEKARRSRRDEADGRTGQADGGVVLRGRDDDVYTADERALAWLWARELGVSELDVHESSFALGGDSLTALRIARSIEKTMDVRVSIVDLFAHDTIATLAEHVGVLRAGADVDATMSTHHDHEEPST